MNFDEQARQTISSLSAEFSQSYETKEDLNCIFSIGAEIEVKFKYFFPDLHQKFFLQKNYSNFSEEEKREFTEAISHAESIILPKLNKTVELGVPRGLDKYWEFAFNPVFNLTLLYYQIRILQSIGLIPPGRHSFHLSIGGRKPNREMFYILMVLELLFIDKERIQSGFSKKSDHFSDTWAKKGFGGIMQKNQYDLIGVNEGSEFRTLYFDENTDLYYMFQLTTKLLNGDYDKELINVLKNDMDKVGLPDSSWEKPHSKPEIWRNYISNFDDLSINLQKKINNFISI